MKNQAPVLLLTLCFSISVLFATAQKQPALKDIRDASLPQLMKEKKDIRFISVPGNGGTTIKWYEENSTQRQDAATQPVAAGATTNFHLTRDINVQTNADPVNNDFIFNNPYAILNGIFYFSANDGIHGNELWRSDGTEAGTYLVKDLVAGSASSGPYELVTAGNKLYFVTQNTALFNNALWVSDGTINGTFQLTTFFRQGPGVNTAYNLTAVGNEVFYFTYGFSNDIILWKINGTSNMVVKEFSDITSGGPLNHEAAGGLFYFTLFSDITGRELYRSDGTEAGTFLVKDISPSTDYFSGPVQLTAFNGKLYFADDDGSGIKLWLTDGTAAGTKPAKNNNDVTLSTSYSDVFINAHFTVQGNNMYMSASAPATGQELYKYNAATGFSLVKDITPGSAGGIPYHITPAFGKIAFAYSDTVTKENQLWAVNEANNARLIKSYAQQAASFDYLTPGNGLLYFVSRTPDAGSELWKTNGTTEGTTLVKDIYAGTISSYPQDLTYVNNTLYFNAASKKTGTELWRTQGNAADTKMVADINTTITDYSGPYFYNGVAADFAYLGAIGATAGSTFYFTATQPETGYELYKSDGTSLNTKLVKDIIPGESGSYPASFTSKNGAVYFAASTYDSTSTTSFNIYKADSLGKVTLVVASYNNYVLSYDVADNGWIYYIDFSPVAGKYELRRNNGIDTNSLILAQGLASANGTFVVRTIGNSAYFTATDEAGIELWKTNGSVAGTKRVTDINPGSNGSNPYSLTAYKNNIYFGADDGTGIALWRSNGTATGTVKLKAIQPYGIYNGPYDYPNYFCVVNDILYLSAYTGTTGYELWKTNGSATGTVLVKDVISDATGSNPAYLTNVNGTLFFNAATNQLWKSDGTTNGTVLITSIVNNNYFLFTSRCVADGKFFFNANRLLWVSDGTEAGTHTVNDNGLNGVSLINNLISSGTTVFCNGYTGKYSYELYAGNAALVIPSATGNSPVVVRKPASFSASVWQNPVGNSVKMNVVSDISQTIRVTISDANGNVKAQQKTTLYKGNNSVAIDAGNWQTGVYLVKLYNAAGDVVSVRVFK